MTSTDPASLLALADQKDAESEAAADEARYAQDLADALDLDRLAMVRLRWEPPAWTVTYRRAVIGEVANDRPEAVLGGWTARPVGATDSHGPFHTARAAASSLISEEYQRPGRHE